MVKCGYRGIEFGVCVEMLDLRSERTTPSADHPADEASAPLLKPGGELNPATPPSEGGELNPATSPSVGLEERTTPSAEAAATPPSEGGEPFPFWILDFGLGSLRLTGRT